MKKRFAAAAVLIFALLFASVMTVTAFAGPDDTAAVTETEETKEEEKETIPDVLLDALLDTVKLIPFLFAAYLLLEFIEHRSSNKLSNFLTNEKFGVPGGAVLGCIPQCGMSVAVSHLFSAGAVGAGTMVAVFISCSDEAIPVLLADFRHIGAIVPLLLSKVAFAVIAGYLFDLIFRRHKFEGGHHSHEHDCDECDKIEEAHHHHCGEKCDENVFLSALKRSGEVLLFILAVNVVMGLIIYFVGEDVIAEFAQRNRMLQPLAAGLIGLIPNCAGSVVLTELYINGSIGFGAVFAGLSVGSGLGYAALFKANKHIKENLMIVGFTFVLSVAAGTVIQLFV
ncbi:MAG: arsenic efflux protein [Clostridia bacterium]|nr:arsenic efflux protein [Clostridia bacterium]